MSSGGRMRPLLWLVLAWSAVVALSAPRLSHPSRGVAEALIILAALVLLVAHDGLRSTLAAAPRALQWPIAGAFAIWLFAQIRELPATTYPLQSGKHPPRPPASRQGWRPRP